jgi:hypothetical protein
MTTKRSPPWNDQENDAVIALYFAMCTHVDNATEYDSAQLIGMAQGMDTDRNSDLPVWAGQLSNRSRGSIEIKLMNVTACLRSLGYAGTTMEQHGYIAMGNYQSTLKPAVAKFIGG